MRMTRLYMVVLAVLLAGGIAVAQDQDPKWNADGEIEEAEFVYVKDKKLELPKANRFFVPVKINTDEISKKTISFSVKEFSFTPEVSLPEIRVQKIPKEPIEKLWGNKLTLGYGNFQSPYIDIALANKRDKLYSYGFNFNHYSFGKGAVDEENSASGITDVSAFGKIYGKKATSYANVGYQHQVDHFYGYTPTDTPPQKDSIRQRFNRFDLRTGIFGTDIKSPLLYKVDLGFNNFSNDFETTENTFDLRSDLTYKLQDDESIKLGINGMLSQYTDSAEISRNLLTLTPAYARKISGIYMTVGFQLAIDNDSLDNSSGASLFPQLNVRFPVSETFDVYGGITGGRQFNTINSFSRENQWIGPNQPLQNSDTKIEVYGGVNGKLGERVSTNLGFSAGGVDNMAFFANAADDSTKFDILYDDVNVFRFMANIEYSFFEKASVHAGATFFGYDTDVLQEAWHKPTFSFEMGSKFNIYEKVIISPSFNLLTGIEAINLESGTAETLDPIVLLNVRARYILSDRAGIYANFNNIIGENYQRYLNYPGRGLQVNIGFNYSF